jgi:catechol 2,3-dioxygenase-like lactoylglutathione lyase family enzyme
MFVDGNSSAVRPVPTREKGERVTSEAQPIECAAIFVVRDIMASVAYFRDALGFEVAFVYGEPTYYAGVCRGAVTIHLISASQTSRPPGASALSVFVGSADDIHRELSSRGAGILTEPADYPYGMRDFNVEDLAGNTLIFGNSTSAKER